MSEAVEHVDRGSACRARARGVPGAATAVVVLAAFGASWITLNELIGVGRRQ